MNELSKYSYKFPGRLIAQAPAKPRDSARLLAYSRQSKEISEATFLDLDKYLPKNAVLVFNRTKVIPARFTVIKETGGHADLLYVSSEGGLVRVMSNRPLPVGSTVTLSSKLKLAVIEHPGKYYLLKPNFVLSRLSSVLERHGRAPLPPYIKESPLSEADRKREYQTVFARDLGSIAAPTASLHFTKRLLAKLKRRGISVRYVTLHVGLGTFAPLTEENMEKGRLHHEEYRISPATAKFLNRAKQEGRPIVAVGTTVCRTLESAADSGGLLTGLSGSTDLFIRDSYRFKFIDGLITNFHVPESSLMMLVSALVGRKELLGLYETAISRGYRLFSFGDGMLLI